MIKAIEHYNNRQIEMENYGNVATKNSDPEFLKRISVNFLRHCCSSYEYELDKIYGKIGRAEAYIIIKNKILDTIANNYNYLAKEAYRQKIWLIYLPWL